MINRLWKSFLAVQIGCVNASSFSFINLSKKKNRLILFWRDDEATMKNSASFSKKIFQWTNWNVQDIIFPYKKKARIDIPQGWMKEWTFALKISNQVSTQPGSESSNEIRQCGEKETRIKQPSWRQASIELWRESYCFLDNDISMLNHINSGEGIIENYGDYSTYIMPILKEGHFIDLRQNTSKLWGIKMTLYGQTF